MIYFSAQSLSTSIFNLIAVIIELSFILKFLLEIISLHSLVLVRQKARERRGVYNFRSLAMFLGQEPKTLLFLLNLLLLR